MGRPSPWSEGIVVRFEPDAGPEWIGNLEPGYGGTTKIVPWEDAHAFIVIADGATYFVRPDAPDDWRHLAADGWDCVLTPSHDLAILCTEDGLSAITRNGSELWSRWLALDGYRVHGIHGGAIHGRAQTQDEEYPFAILLSNGTDAR
jgi:hypothetical protein